MKKYIEPNENFYEYASKFDYDVFVVNKYNSKGWDPTGYDFEENDDLFFNNWPDDDEDEDEYEEDLYNYEAPEDFVTYEGDMDEDEEEEEKDQKNVVPEEEAIPPVGQVNVTYISDYITKKNLILTITSEYTRNRNISNELKVIYQDTCQVCGFREELNEGSYFCETHHIHPRGSQGPDVRENMIVLCCNCHKCFDKGLLTIDLVTRKISHVNPEHTLHNRALTLKHVVFQKYVNYHNLFIFNKSGNNKDM